MEVDLLTASICVSVALVSAVAVYLGSVFVIKEKTFDEAIEEQRKLTLLDFGSDIKGGGGKKSEKDKKSKKDKKDKDKDKDKDKKKKKNEAAKGGGSGEKIKPGIPEKEGNKTVKAKTVEKKELAVAPPASNVEDQAGANVPANSGSTVKIEKTPPMNQSKAKSSEDIQQPKPVNTSKVTSDTSSQQVSSAPDENKIVSPSQPVSPSKKKASAAVVQTQVKDTVDQKKSEIKGNTSGTGNQKVKPGKKGDIGEPAQVGVSNIKEDTLKGAAGKENKGKQGVEGTGIPVNESKKEAGDAKPVREPKNREIKESKPKEISRDTLDAGLKEASASRQVDGLAIVEETIKSEEAKGNLASPGKKAKKPKSKTDSGRLDYDLSFKQLMDHVNNHPFDSEEIQLLINVLLGKQSDETNQWKKKHDPMESIKEQLHEKEQEAATLSQNLQTTRARMKELRLDLEREKSVHAMTKEKLGQHGTELNNLRNSLQQVIEQQRMETKVLQSKLKDQESDLQARNIAIQRLNDETVNLKLALQQMEAERANLESIPRLHNEIERLRAERGQMERHSQALQQNNDELLRNIEKMSEQIKSLNAQNNTKQNEEYSLQKKLKELQEQLRQHDANKAALLEDYKSSVDKMQKVEQEKQMIEKEKQMVEKKMEDEMKNLREKIRELEQEKERLQEASHNKASSDEEKDGVINRLKDEINKLNNERGRYEEELKRANKAADDIKQELDLVKKESEVKVNEALTKSRAAFEEQLKKELEKVNKDKESVEKQLSEISSEKASLEAEKARFKESLLKINQQEQDIFKSLDHLIDELVKLRAEKADNSQVEKLELELNTVRSNLKNEQDRLEKAQAEAEKFKDTLSKTDEYLKVLEQKSKEAFEQSSNATKECQRLQELVDKLEQDKSVLESNLSQVDNLKKTIKDLQAKNDELQLKLDVDNKVELIEEPAQENGKEEQNGKVDEVNEETDNNDEKSKKKSPKWKKWVVKMSS